MSLSRKLGSQLLSLTLVLGLASVPFVSDASAKRSNLTSVQKTEFKQQKRNIQQRQKAAQRKIRDLTPKLARATREYHAAGVALMTENAAFQNDKRALDRRISYEQGRAKAEGRSYQPTTQIVQLEGYIAAGNAALQRTAANFDNKFAAMQSGRTELGQARTAGQQANNDLAIRAANKNAARADNLRAATDRKAARKLRPAGPSSVAPNEQIPEFPSLAGLSGRSTSSSIFADFVAAGDGPNNSANSGRGSVREFSILTPDSALGQSGRPSSRPASVVFSQLISDRSRSDSLGPTRQAPGRIAFSRADSANNVPVPGYGIARSLSSQIGAGYTIGPPSARTSYVKLPPPVEGSFSRANSDSNIKS
jgi:hypothetical protein